jgi:hypothetical protein
MLLVENTNNGVGLPDLILLERGATAASHTLMVDVVGGEHQQRRKNDYSILISGSFFKYPRDTKNASASTSVFL